VGMSASRVKKLLAGSGNAILQSKKKVGKGRVWEDSPDPLFTILPRGRRRKSPGSFLRAAGGGGGKEDFFTVRETHLRVVRA